MAYAHYFATKTRKFIIITPSPSLSDGCKMEIEVESKTEARAKAAFWNAKCWNF